MLNEYVAAFYVDSYRFRAIVTAIQAAIGEKAHAIPRDY
jgi:hypothetical protein